MQLAPLTWQVNGQGHPASSTGSAGFTRSINFVNHPEFKLIIRPGSNENCHILNLRFCLNSVSTPSEGAASHELRAERRLLNKGHFYMIMWFPTRLSGSLPFNASLHHPQPWIYSSWRNKAGGILLWIIEIGLSGQNHQIQHRLASQDVVIFAHRSDVHINLAPVDIRQGNL